MYIQGRSGAEEWYTEMFYCANISVVTDEKTCCSTIKYKMLV